jgi:hypothetical protein
MGDTQVTIEIDGSPLADAAVRQLVEIQVEDSALDADAASVTAPLLADSGGEWSSLVDAMAEPRTALVVTLKRGDAEYRFDGLATDAAWRIEPGDQSQMTAKAVDRTIEMNLEEKVTDWSGTNDSAIAESILSDHGFATEVESTPDVADPDTHVVIQRATDWAFLRSLAAKWGYTVYLESRMGTPYGVFGPLDPTADPQGDLTLGFANPSPVSAHAQLVAGREVRASRLAPLSDEVLEGDDGGTGDAQGSVSLGGQSIVLISPADVDGEIDPTDAAKGLARRSAFALRLEVEVDADQIDTVVRAGRTINVGGLGSRLSGLYLVERVRHRVTPEGHSQQLTLTRNAFGCGAGVPAGGAAAGAAALAGLFSGSGAAA